MSGILDNKSRILDVIATLEGRRQISTGDLRVKFVSFTDSGTYYSEDLVSGSSDATKRIFLEQCNLPQDQITFEADDSGRLQSFKNENGVQVNNGRLIEHTFNATSGSQISGSSETMKILKGDEFASSANSLLNSSLENFQKLQVISTKNLLFEDDAFGVGQKNITFTIHDQKPIPNRDTWISHIDQTESFFNDPRLLGVKNFKYLPPVNRINDDNIDKSDYRQTSNYHLGHYPSWGRPHLFKLTYEQIKFELDYYGDLGYSKVINFDPTSHDNKLLIQMFEQGFDELRKLDVIDYGQHQTGDSNSPLAHIFFVGRIFEDDNDTHTFIHLFTLLFE